MKIKSIEIEYEDGSRARFLLETGLGDLGQVIPDLRITGSWKRCELCKGVGRTADGDYCGCAIGRDLKLMERRNVLENTVGNPGDGLTLPRGSLPEVPDISE